MDEIGARLRAARVARNLSQAAVAQHLGFTEKTVRRWERGEYSPPASTLLEMAELYRVPVESLFPETNGAAA